MALQHKTLGKTYLRYLFAGLGSAVIVSIYSIVDAIMVGKYEGSNGTAALSIVMPIWTIILSLGLLFGVGGGSLMSKARGEGDEKRGREIFTVAFICAVVVALLIWGLLLAFENSLLRLFGADDSLLPLAKKYLKWMKFSMPLFTMGQFLSCFIRNDNAPTKAMAAVITGGVFNIGGDYFFGSRTSPRCLYSRFSFLFSAKRIEICTSQSVFPKSVGCFYCGLFCICRGFSYGNSYNAVQ